MTMTPDEVLAQLRTRGFEKGFQRTPLREFKGKLESITGGMVDRFTPPRLEILLNFEELSDVVATEPYPFPIAQISIMQSVRESSFWGVFGTSVDKIINAGIAVDAPPEQVKQIAHLIGQRLHLKITGGHMMWDAQKGEETPRECWELVAVVGEAPVAGAAPPAPAAPGAIPETKIVGATQRALQLLEGKTEQDWYQTVFQDPAVKADAALVDSILARTFLSPLETLGTIFKDDNGIYHVAQEA